MASSSFSGREEVPSSSQGSGSPSLEDQLLEERELLKNEIFRIHGDHKKAVDLLRSSLEKDVQDANALIGSLRQEVSNQLKSNEELMRQQNILTQKDIQSKNALTAAEEHNSRLTTEKNNLVQLLENTQSEISDLRGTIAKQSLDSSEKFGEVELLKMKMAGKDSEIEFLKISEKGLKSQSEQLRSDVGTLHSQLVEKDREISRVRAECDRLLKDSAKQMSSLDDNLWQEKRNGIRLQDSLIHQTETVQLLQDKVSELGAIKNRLQDNLTAQNSSHQQIVEDLRKHMASLKERNDQLEEEKKAQEAFREELEDAYNDAMAKLQEEMSTVRNNMEEKSSEVKSSRDELDSARELLAYLKHDTSRGPVSPELLELVRGHGFSVPRLYHEYRIVVEKLTEAENVTRALQTELETHNQEWQQFVEDRNREESVVDRVTKELEKLQGDLKRQTTVNESLEEQSGVYRRNLRMMEHENRLLKGKNAQLQRQLVTVLDGDAQDDGTATFHNLNPQNQSVQFRSTQELVEVNLGLYSSMEALSKENLELKEQIEISVKNEQEFAQAVEQVRSIVEQKEAFERRMTELAQEVQLYRMQNDSSLFKEFLRTMAASTDQIDTMLSLAENESAMWAFIRAHGGNDAADKFAVVQREMNSLRQELQEAKLDAQKRRNELDRLSETRDVQLKSALDSRDKALDDIAILRKQLDATRQENDNRAAEAAHQLTKLTELYERLCASEKESTTINHALDNQKELVARTMTECQSLRLEKAALVSRMDILSEQQVSMQNALNQESAVMQEWHLRQTRISKELQEAQQTASQNQANEASLQRELQSERLKLDAATKELSEVKKQLEDSRLAASRATSSTTQDQPSNLNLLQSSPGTSHVSSDFAINIIRQSSLQQDALQQKILTLQTQLESAQNDLAARTKELEAKQEEHIKWIKEMNAVKASMLTDIHHIKEDREGLRVQFNLLQTEKVRLTSDNARFNEENRRQRQEQAELMTRYMSELQAHQSLATAAADLRKELDQLKQTIQASKRREQDLQKSLEDLYKKSEDQEKSLREEVRLLEEERENAKGWKRALYDQARPASTSILSDEVQDLTILIEHQKKENESISRQLQLSKEEGFANTAKIKSLNQTVFRLQEELQLVMEKQDVTSNLTSWHESYTEQLTILASAMEVNAKLRTDLSMALRELDDLKASLAVSSKSSEALTGRVRDLEQVNIRLNEESRTLKEQLENWNSRFGVNQQKDEIEGLKKKIIDLEKQLQEQIAAFERRREELKRSFSKQMQEKVESKTKHHAVAEEELKKKVEALQTELSASKVSLTDKQTELVALSRTFRKKLEALDQAQKEALHTAHAQRDEMRHLGEENAELKENLARLSEKTAEDADLPRTTPAPSPALKSTAVVTPQTQVAPPQLLSRPTITARPPHPPVAAVAPQAQEQLHLQPVISAINQVDALAVVLPVNAETSEMPSGSSGLAGGTQTASTPGGIVGSRRRPAEEEQSDSVDAPLRKRGRIAVKASGSKTLLLQLRPPSPTSMSDVTSSTTPAVITPTVSSAVPGPEGSSHSSRRPLSAPHTLVMEPIASINFAPPVIDELMEEQSGPPVLEEGTVDSSAEVPSNSGAQTGLGIDDLESAVADQDIQVGDNEVEMDETVTIQGQEYIEDVTEEAVASPIQPPETIIEEHIDVSSAAPVEFPDDGIIQGSGDDEAIGVVEVEHITSSAAAAPFRLPFSQVAQIDGEAAQPVVEFPPEDEDDGGEEDIDSEILDRVLGPIVGDGDRNIGPDPEEGEISDDDNSDDGDESEDDASETVAVGLDMEAPGDEDIDSSLSDQVANTTDRPSLSAAHAAPIGRASAEHILSDGRDIAVSDSTFGVASASASLPILRRTGTTVRSSVPVSEPTALRLPTTLSNSSNSTLTPGSGSPQRPPLRRPISPPRQSSSQSESGSVSTVITGRPLRPRTDPALYFPGNMARRGVGPPAVRGEGRGMPRGPRGGGVTRGRRPPFQ